jgi:hypothetical protein
MIRGAVRKESIAANKSRQSRATLKKAPVRRSVLAKVSASLNTFIIGMFTIIQKLSAENGMYASS